jgi:hypothetical protein
MEEVIKIGNLYTETIFKADNGNRIKLSITLGTEYTTSNKLTYYVFYVYLKLKRQKKWRTVLTKATRQDVQSLNALTDQQIYNAMYNHWQSINPISHFSNGSLNGVDLNHTVKGRYKKGYYFKCSGGNGDYYKGSIEAYNKDEATNVLIKKYHSIVELDEI